jgi:hypothetical protein
MVLENFKEIIRMIRETLTSSALRSVGWEFDVLEVEFKDGQVWRYENVPLSAFKEMMNGRTTPGKYFYANIRSRFKGMKV